MDSNSDQPPTFGSRIGLKSLRLVVCVAVSCHQEIARLCAHAFERNTHHLDLIQASMSFDSAHEGSSPTTTLKNSEGCN